MMTVNQEHAGNANSMSLVERSGSKDRFTGAYLDMTGATLSPRNYASHLNGSPMMNNSNKVQIKPTLLERNLAGNRDFETLPENFKQIFTGDTKDQQMKIPIVGYGGHRKGETSENIYAKNYRDAAMQSTRNQRQLMNNSPSYFTK